jgi:hypothetical protein
MNPDAQASFSDVLIADLAGHCFASYAPLHTWKLGGWGGGDTALADPSVGIPMNWVTFPIRKYHHNSIISDFSCLDPVFYHVNMTINVTFAYFLAAAGSDEAAWLASRVASQARKTMLDEVDAQLQQCFSRENWHAGEVLENVARRLDYQKMLFGQRLGGLKRLAGAKDARAQECISRFSREVAGSASEGMRTAERRIRSLWPRSGPPAPPARKKLTAAERQAQAIVPKRKTLGLPVQYVRVPRDKRQKVYQLERLDALVWVDGKRSLLDIIHMVENERGEIAGDIRDYIKYFRALIRYGYLEDRNKRRHK